VRVGPSGKSVDPKFLSSNDVLAHSRIVEEYASIRELIASVNASVYEDLTVQMSSAPPRHDCTDGQARRLHLNVRRSCPAVGGWG
jgi:hypothetical protein